MGSQKYKHNVLSMNGRVGNLCMLCLLGRKFVRSIEDRKPLIGKMSLNLIPNILQLFTCSSTTIDRIHTFYFTNIEDHLWLLKNKKESLTCKNSYSNDDYGYNFDLQLYFTEFIVGWSVIINNMNKFLEKIVEVNECVKWYCSISNRVFIC